MLADMPRNETAHGEMHGEMRACFLTFRDIGRDYHITRVRVYLADVARFASRDSR